MSNFSSQFITIFPTVYNLLQFPTFPHFPKGIWTALRCWKWLGLSALGRYDNKMTISKKKELSVNVLKHPLFDNLVFFFSDQKNSPFSHKIVQECSNGLLIDILQPISYPYHKVEEINKIDFTVIHNLNSFLICKDS
jgi:hypothetical protein